MGGLGCGFWWGRTAGWRSGVGTVLDRGPAVCVGGFGPLRAGVGGVAVAVGGVWHFAGGGMLGVGEGMR